MKTKDGHDLTIDTYVFTDKNPEIYLDIGPYEGEYAYLSIKEARKMRTLLTRNIRLAESNVKGTQAANKILFE